MSIAQLAPSFPSIPDLEFASTPFEFGQESQEVWRDSAGQIGAYGGRSGELGWIHFVNVGTFQFSLQAGGVKVFTQNSAAPEFVRDTYYRAALPLILQARGMELLHASAVRTSGGVVGFCADSGTGKSTLAYGLSRRGYMLWADDALAIAPSESGFQAVALPFRIRLRPSPSLFFGASGEADFVFQPGSELLSALFILRQVTSRREVVVDRLSPSQGLVALLSNAYSFVLDDLERKRGMMKYYLHLASVVPIYEIHFPSTLESLPTLLDQVEQSIA